MSYDFPKSLALFERAQKSIAGGVNSGIRKMEQPVPLYFDHGKGSRLFDVDGNEYIDFQIGQGAILYGHAPEGMADAIAAQARKGTHWAAQSELEIDVAERLQKMIPGAERVRFNNSATEVVLSAFRLARAHTGRPLILKFEGHYHGWSDEGLVGFAPAPDKWGDEEHPSRLHPSQGVIPEVLGTFVVARWNDPEHLRRCVDEHRGQIAAIIFEPVLCNTGCIEPVPGMISMIRELCDRDEMLMIADETITGFRFGAGCAQEYLGFTPDLTILGKAIGGGTPFAALAGKEAAFKKIISGEVVHAGTLNANPLCLAAAKWCLDEVIALGDTHPGEMIRLGNKLMTGLSELAKKHGIPMVPQGPGLVFHCAMLKSGAKAGPIRDYRDYVTRHDAPRWAHLRRCLLEEGVRAIERGLWFISLAHTEADIDEALEKAETAFARHAAEWKSDKGETAGANIGKPGKSPAARADSTSQPRRILLAGLFHETHTFLNGTTGFDDFTMRRGDGLLDCKGDASPLGGVLEFADQEGWEIIPTVDYRATPGAIVEDEVIEQFWREFREHAAESLSAGVDAIYLVLHGAMVSQSLDDVEGELLQRIRKLPGGESVPIFGVFDLHANFTRRMADLANCLVAYRENPHTDAREAGLIGARLLKRCLESGEVPRMFWHHPPLMWPPTGTATSEKPMRELESLARDIEQQNEYFWTVSVVGGFSFADTPDTGVSFVIAATGSGEAADKALRSLGDLAMEQKEAGNVQERPIAVVMKTIDPPPPGLTVLVEPSDNIGAGAPGDGTGILRTLIEHMIPNSAVCINDPQAVERLQQVRRGEVVWLPIGGKGSKLDKGPVVVEVELVSHWSGLFELEDKNSHLASMCGDTFDMGPCSVVKHQGVTILLTSNRTPPFDLGQWRSQGLEPTRFSVIGVKAAVAHRRAYDPIASRMIWVDTPGPCSSNLKSLPFQKIKRPVYPLD
jgi:glutamate-1-semialdehyde 2,1-aminomutase